MKAPWRIRILMAGLLALASWVARPSTAVAQTGVDGFLTWWNGAVVAKVDAKLDSTLASVGITPDTDPATAFLLSQAAAGAVVTLPAVAAGATGLDGAQLLELVYYSYVGNKVREDGVAAAQAINRGDVAGAFSAIEDATLSVGLLHAFGEVLPEAGLILSEEEQSLIDTTVSIATELATEDVITAFDEFLDDEWSYFFEDGVDVEDFRNDVSSQCDGCSPPDPLYLEPAPDMSEYSSSE